MVDKIVEHLLNKLSDRYHNCSSDDKALEDAEGIMNLIEDAGMQPPFSHAVFHYNWVRSRDPNCGGNEWDSELEDSWEPGK
jgi:hypothetical protein